MTGEARGDLAAMQALDLVCALRARDPAALADAMAGIGGAAQLRLVAYALAAMVAHAADAGGTTPEGLRVWAGARL